MSESTLAINTNNSPSASPTYKLNGYGGAMEGNNVMLDLETTNIKPGTAVELKIIDVGSNPSGYGKATLDDFVDGKLPVFIVDEYGKASIQISIAIDKLAEHTETLTLAIANDTSKSVTLDIYELPNHTPTGDLFINGEVNVEKTLTIKNNISDLDGLDGQFKYEWQANDDYLATGDKVTLTRNEIGKTIHVITTYTDNLGNLETVKSTNTPPVTKSADSEALTVTPKTKPYNEVKNTSNFAVLKADGSVFEVNGGSYNGWNDWVIGQLDGTIDATQIYSNQNAFAVLRIDGSVISWGMGGMDTRGKSGTLSFDPMILIDSQAIANRLNGDIDVKQIYSNMNTFAALRTDGSLYIWGADGIGGKPITADSTGSTFLNGTVDVMNVYALQDGFAALRTDGSVVLWGKYALGYDSSIYSSAQGTDSITIMSPQLDGAIPVTKVFTANHAAAALRADGSVVSLGGMGIKSGSDLAKQLDGTVDVVDICTGQGSFAALRTDGSVITWGNGGTDGGDSRKVASKLDGTINVTQLASTGTAFAAIRDDGSVVTWGNQDAGGDSSEVADQLNGKTHAKEIYSTGSSYQGGAFAAIREDGSVVSWGSIYNSTNVSYDPIDTSSVANQLNGKIDVVQIYTTGSAFAALRADGSVVTWGSKEGGGDSSEVASQLDGKVAVTQIYSTNDGASYSNPNAGFAALRADGSVVSWGSYIDYGVSGQATEPLTVGDAASDLNGDIDVVKIFSLSSAFAALRADGSVITWGDKNAAGSDSVAVMKKLNSGVVSFADVTTDDFYDASSGNKPINHAPTGVLKITGESTQGQALTVVSTLSDADGMGTIYYQWLRNGALIGGATKTAYDLTADDLGKAISVTASYTDQKRNLESVTSDPTSAIAAPTNHLPTGDVKISGTIEEKQTLKLQNTLADEDIIASPFNYQWLRNGKVIDGANNDSYALVKDDVGKKISIQVSYTDSWGNVESKTSKSTIPVKNGSLDGILKTGSNSGDKIIGTAKNDSLSGLAGNDTIQGMAGNDTLDGSNGADSLDGGNGNDVLLAGDGNDKLLGGSGNDSLEGNVGNDSIDSGAGNDTLNGGVGVDTMTGGDGSDYYVVDHIKDVVTETNKNVKLGGLDTVETTSNYVLPKNVENLILKDSQGKGISGTGNEVDNAITGSIGDDDLKGMAGNDKLNGGDGLDTLDGGLGMDTLTGGNDSDTYVVNNLEDTIVELANGGDQDQISSTVDYDLTSNDNIEVLTLSDTKAINGIGNSLDNLVQEQEGGIVDNNLSGEEGDDILDGHGGNDTLEGGIGNDTLEGGDGEDTAIFSGASGDYKLTPNSDDNQIVVEFINSLNTDLIDEGMDILTNVEFIQFSDTTLDAKLILTGIETF